ncbi:MAG: glycosyltransferase family 9 protein [Planctomycetaceae bacterium]|nr:glycosyltransferase family 9 protein [Planctomycetaceae bacterium]
MIDPQSKPKRVLVFRALMLGDMLCAVPAFRALRRGFPESQIVLLGLPWARAFVARFSALFDGFLPFPGYPGLPERPVAVRVMPRFLTKMQALGFDWAIQMHGDGSCVNPLVGLLGANRTAGFYRTLDYCPDHETFLPYPDGEAEVRRHLLLMAFLGVPPQGEELEFPITTEDRRSLAAIPQASALRPKRYVCIHPGARYPSRRWTPRGFAQVGDALAAAGFAIALTGSASESPLTRAVAEAMTAPAVNLAGRTSLGALAALVERSRLLVTNDTGVSHIAAAVKTPSVVVVLGSDPARWAPLDSRRHRVVMQPVDCRPCAAPNCPIGMPCAAAIPAEAVIHSAMTLVKENA